MTSQAARRCYIRGWELWRIARAGGITINEVRRLLKLCPNAKQELG